MPTNDSRSDSRSITRYAKAAVVHKVIDITPGAEGEARKTSAAQLFAIAERYKSGLYAVAAAVFAVVILVLAVPHGRTVTVGTTPVAGKSATLTVAKGPQGAMNAAPTVVLRTPEAPKQPVIVEINLQTAVQQGMVDCQWRGNGKDRLVMDARNVSGQLLRLHLGAGQLLASVDSTVIVLKAQTLDMGPRGELHEEFQTAATSSGNRVAGAEYHLTAGVPADLDKMVTYIATHTDVTMGAIQTATLILTENLPLSAFAKFNELSAGVDVQESRDFKAETVDIVSALTMIRDLGVDRPLAVTIDPQLEVESMIDPGAHALAVRYYGINDEWAYWKGQLLQGDPSTRHYALYGIARFYPDIALQMLPKWARQEAGSPVYRMSAVEALAQTGKAEAIPILRQLETEFGGTSDLGKAAHAGANVLDAQFARSSKVGARLSAATRSGRKGGLASSGN